jgi:hypothetical protein
MAVKVKALWPFGHNRFCRVSEEIIGELRKLLSLTGLADTNSYGDLIPLLHCKAAGIAGLNRIILD